MLLAGVCTGQLWVASAPREENVPTFSGWRINTICVRQSRVGDLLYTSDGMGEREYVVSYEVSHEGGTSSGEVVRGWSAFARLYETVMRELPGVIVQPPEDIVQGFLHVLVSRSELSSARCVVAWFVDIPGFEVLASSWSSTDEMWLAASIARVDHATGNLGSCARWRAMVERELVPSRDAVAAQLAAAKTAREALRKVWESNLFRSELHASIVSTASTEDNPVDTMVRQARSVALAAACADLARHKAAEARRLAQSAELSHKCRSSRLNAAARRETEAQCLETMGFSNVSLLRARASIDLAVAKWQADDSALEKANQLAVNLEERAELAARRFRNNFAKVVAEYPRLKRNLVKNFVLDVVKLSEADSMQARLALRGFEDHAVSEYSAADAVAHADPTTVDSDANTSATNVQNTAQVQFGPPPTHFHSRQHATNDPAVGGAGGVRLGSICV